MKTNNILSINQFKSTIETNSRLIAIDPGSKNIGIAICDENQTVATPLKTIVRNKFENVLSEINTIISENRIKGIIVGNPINMDGSIGKSSQSATDFTKNLSINITIPITMWDERLSSEAVFKISKKLGSNSSNRVKKLDENAAAFILQGVIDFFAN
jgi:putative Holliday junction resolvase